MSSTEQTHLDGILSGECAADQQGSNNELAEINESLEGYAWSAIVEGQDCISVTSSTYG